MIYKKTLKNSYKPNISILFLRLSYCWVFSVER